jgi:hypothetical protein
MKNYPVRYCEICSSEHKPAGPAARFCEQCADMRRAESRRQIILRSQIKKGVKVGSGKGGNNAAGIDDSQYKTGITFFVKTTKTIRDEVRFCERCGKDLIDAKPFEWATHHRDHDRTNNSRGNFELLCKRCHQLEHECREAFSKVQRPSSNGVGSSAPEVPDTVAA